MDALDLDMDDLAIPEFEGAETVTASNPMRRSDDLRTPYPRDDRAAPPDTSEPASDDPLPTALSACLAFRGVGGGAGTTSLAIASAHALHRRTRRPVCVIDLDFELGMVAHYLDIGSTPSLDDLRADPARVDDTFARALVSHHDSGLAVVAASGLGAGANDLVDPGTVLALLDRLADLYPLLVLDVPRLHRPWTRAALLAADSTCVVGEANIPALHVCRTLIDAMAADGVGDIRPVLNKYERRSFRATIRKSDAERALAREVCATVAVDAATPAEAMNCGEPATRIAADSRYAKDVAALVAALLPQATEKAGKRRARR